MYTEEMCPLVSESNLEQDLGLQCQTPIRQNFGVVSILTIFLLRI